MPEDSNLRNVGNYTNSDFVDFEMQMDGNWRRFRISGTALALLGARRVKAPLSVFEQHLGRIKQIAHGLGAADSGNGRVAITSADV